MIIVLNRGGGSLGTPKIDYITHGPALIGCGAQMIIVVNRGGWSLRIQKIDYIIHGPALIGGGGGETEVGDVAQRGDQAC